MVAKKKNNIFSSIVTIFFCLIVISIFWSINKDRVDAPDVDNSDELPSEEESQMNVYLSKNEILF